MCWDNDGDWVELRSGERVARKQHRCAEGCLIQPGDRYHWAVGTYEGEFVPWKACDPCVKAARALGDACRLYERWSTDPPIGMLSDAYHEHLECGELDTSVVPTATVWKLRRQYVSLRKRAAA